MLIHEPSCALISIFGIKNSYEENRNADEEKIRISESCN